MLGRGLTYLELDRRANGVAHALRAAGVGPDVLVGICIGRGLDMVASLLAIHKAGGAYVPLDPDYPPERLRLYIEDSQVAVIITDPIREPLLPEGDFRKIVVGRDPIEEEEQPPPCAATSSDLAYIIYTSGSTGRPKGVMVEHGNVVHFLTAMDDILGLQEPSTWLAVTSISFDISVLELFWPLTRGFHLLLHPGNEPLTPQSGRRFDGTRQGPEVPDTDAPGQTITELLATGQVTHFQCTPSMATMLLVDDEGRAGMVGLRALLIGGEAMPVALARDLLSLLKEGSCGLFNVYGPTETTVWSSSHLVTDASGEIPIGRPLANSELLILDARGAPVAPGEQGELFIGGTGVTRGYLRRPELTGERFVPNPRRPGERAYRTGDRASFREDGVVCFHGRIDQQVKIHGYRIEPGEIEARLGEHPGVHQCVVVAREDSPGNNRLVAYLIPRAGALDLEEVRHFLSKRLPAYMVPASFVALESFPQTPNRKVDRKALPPPPRMAITDASLARSSETPSGFWEEAIAVIWRELLEREEVGVNENFFDLGGHSLLTIQLLGRLKPRVDRPLSLVDLFRYPTIRSLVAFLQMTGDPSTALDSSIARGVERQRARHAMVDRRQHRAS